MPETNDSQRIARELIPLGPWGDTLTASYYGSPAVAYGGDSIASLQYNGVNAPEPLFKTRVSERQLRDAEKRSKNNFKSTCIRCGDNAKQDSGFQGAVLFNRQGDVLVYNDSRDLSDNTLNRFGDTNFGDIGGTTFNPSQPYSSARPIFNLFGGGQDAGVAGDRQTNCQQVIDDCKQQFPDYKNDDEQAKYLFACIDAGGCRDATVEGGGRGGVGGFFDSLLNNLGLGDWKNIATTLLVFLLIGGAALLIASQGLKKVTE